MKPFLTSLMLLSAVLLADPKSYREFLQLDHPYCREPIALEIAEETFVEVTNDDEGTNDYNRLISHYRERNWAKFDKELQVFYELHPKSALKEAAAALVIQIALTKQAFTDSEIEKAEKSFREFMVLYPKSTLTPTLIMTLASVWLDVKNYSKAAQLYEGVYQQYPHHSMQCAFLMGSAESSFHQHAFEHSNKFLDHISQKCKNTRILIGVLIRRADTAWLKGQDHRAMEQYRATLDKYPQFVRQFYPNMIVNFAELLYRQREYASARSLFTDYLKFTRKTSACITGARKRLADIAFYTGENFDDIVGKYLEVFDQDPASDLGKYSRLMSLWANIHLQSASEIVRRFKIAEEFLPQIKDEKTRENIFLVKGLIGLDLGVPESTQYLLRMNTVLKGRLVNEGAGNFVREHLLANIKKLNAALKNESHPKTEISLRGDVFDSYENWLRKTPLAVQARTIFKDSVLRQFSYEIKTEHVRKALLNLLAGLESKLDEDVLIDSQEKREIQKAIVSRLIESAPDISKKIASILSSESERFLLRLGSFPEWVVTYIAFIENNSEKLKGLSKLRPPNEKWFSGLDAIELKKMMHVANLRYVEILVELKRWKEAERTLETVKIETLGKAVRALRITIYREQKKDSLYLTALLNQAQDFEGTSKTKILNDAVALLVEKKIWKQATSLEQILNKQVVEVKDKARFLTVVAQASYEVKDYKKAVELFRSIELLDKEILQVPEQMYRWARSELISKNQDQASALFLQVVQLGHDFWSPLAQVEIEKLSRKPASLQPEKKLKDQTVKP